EQVAQHDPGFGRENVGLGGRRGPAGRGGRVRAAARLVREVGVADRGARGHVQRVVLADLIRPVGRVVVDVARVARGAERVPDGVLRVLAGAVLGEGRDACAIEGRRDVGVLQAGVLAGDHGGRVVVGQVVGRGERLVHADFLVDRGIGLVTRGRVPAGGTGGGVGAAVDAGVGGRGEVRTGPGRGSRRRGPVVGELVGGAGRGARVLGDVPDQLERGRSLRRPVDVVAPVTGAAAEVGLELGQRGP